jgi:hypothetical protein
MMSARSATMSQKRNLRQISLLHWSQKKRNPKMNGYSSAATKTYRLEWITPRGISVPKPNGIANEICQVASKPRRGSSRSVRGKPALRSANPRDMHILASNINKSAGVVIPTADTAKQTTQMSAIAAEEPKLSVITTIASIKSDLFRR